MKLRVLSALLITLLVLVGCRQTNEPTAENVTIDVALDSEMAMVGDATLLVTVSDEDGNGINDASVSVQGDMTHAGMVPVIPDAVTSAEDGVYAIPFEFTMGGDWIITVDVTLANGETASTTYDIDGVEGEMSDMDMDDMDMDDMDMDDMDMDNMGSAVSGAYMSITNNSAEDVTLISVSSDGAGMVEIHETSVDENDIASMAHLEDGILIPAGETVDLMPGGMHVMLMGIEASLVDGETVALTLEFDNGTNIVLDAPIVNIAPEESEAVEADDLSVTGYWARPVTVSDMSGMDMDDDDSMEMDMEATEETGMEMDMEATEESE